MNGKPPTLRIDLKSPVAVYRQIVDGLRAYLVEGKLGPGDTLPSVRRLAIELGVAFTTVAQAYRELADEGWLDLRHGRRVTVLKRTAPESAGTRRIEGFRQRLRELAAQMRAAGVDATDLTREMRNLSAKLEEE